jgi:hypothetical protein
MRVLSLSFRIEANGPSLKRYFRRMSILATAIQSLSELEAEIKFDKGPSLNTPSIWISNALNLARFQSYTGRLEAMFLHTILKDAKIAGLQDLKRVKLVFKNTHWGTWTVLAERRQVLDCAEGSIEWRKETLPMASM